MDSLGGFIASAVVIEGIVSYVTEIISKQKIEWKNVLAIALGCLIAFNLGLDFFKLIGLNEMYGVIGTILTGILISRGSNYVFELYNKLTNWKNEVKNES